MFVYLVNELSLCPNLNSNIKQIEFIFNIVQVNNLVNLKFD